MTPLHTMTIMAIPYPKHRHTSTASCTATNTILEDTHGHEWACLTDERSRGLALKCEERQVCNPNNPKMVSCDAPPQSPHCVC